MNQDEWITEVRKRIAINEGRRNVMYHDSVGIPTIGVGFNLQRPDADHILKTLGSSLHDVMAGHALTDDQVDKLFAYSLAPILSEARASLQSGHFDLLSDARRFVLIDLVFNLGAAGWMDFAGTRSLLDQAVAAKATNNIDLAHRLFNQAADHLEASTWFSQVGNRARRNVAMIRSGQWVDPLGNGQ